MLTVQENGMGASKRSIVTHKYDQVETYPVALVKWEMEFPTVSLCIP